MSNLNLEILSPTGTLFKGECHLVATPSIDGDVGFMQGHELIITALREGHIEIFDEKQNSIKSFPVTTGFAEMKDENNLLILVD